MSGVKFRDCGFSERGSRAICLAHLKSRHAIEGQSNSPTGDVSVAKTEQPRLGSTLRARPSTVKGTRSIPKCDGVAARLSPARNQMYQRISIMYQKCKQLYAWASSFGEEFVAPTNDADTPFLKVIRDLFVTV